jgi:hypothetical protein
MCSLLNKNNPESGIAFFGAGWIKIIYNNGIIAIPIGLLMDLPVRLRIEY